jgi:P-type Mg2+ transporter
MKAPASTDAGLQSPEGPSQASDRGTLTLADAACLPAPVVLSRLGVGSSGLSGGEAAARLASYGPNVLATRRVTALGVLTRQLRNPLLILLVGAAAVSGLTGDPTDALIIGTIIILSVGLGFVNEYRSERAVSALHARTHHTTLVTRDGSQRPLDVRDLVPGDIVSLRVGDVVPADVRLLEASRLECDEAVLTGESVPCEKRTDALDLASGLDLSSCAFMGTVVHQGSGQAVVVSTGSATEFGRIAVGLSAPVTSTSFQIGLRDFSKLLVWVAGILTVAIFAINIALSRPFIEALLFSLAIAIGITPQLLPAIVSVSLSAGSRDLARRKVLVKRLVTIEDLGNIQVLFTDKTGTLTQGAIGFDRTLSPDGVPLERAYLLGLICNEATATKAGPVGGNALDQALWLRPGTSEIPEGYTRIGFLPFDHERQLASVTTRTPGGETVLVTKGAPEAVLARCVGVPQEAGRTVAGLFDDGLRVVAVAERSDMHQADPQPEDERDLTLVGFLTFKDPPKDDAGTSVAKLNALGIQVKIITGDNGAVAARVCKDIDVPLGAVLSGTDVDRLDDDALSAAIPDTTVFARVSPEQKSRVIKVARRRGEDVAFLGDGVNDAIALHAADVGISVESATDVAKDAADIVLLDKDLGVLADGVREGRRIFANTLKYVLMATSSNFGNMFSAAGASLFLSFLPMLPSQILLNNLLYDVGQMAIPTDNVDPETVARPAAWDIAFVRRFMAVFGPISSIFDFLTFFVMLQVLNAGHAEFRTGWFVESIATQTLVVFLIRTRRVPFLRSRPSRPMMITPTAMAMLGAALPFTGLAHLLGFTPLPARFFAILVAMVIAYLGLVEITKRWFYRRELGRLRRPPTTHHQRLRHRRRRRAGRFVRHLPAS